MKVFLLVATVLVALVSSNAAEVGLGQRIECLRNTPRIYEKQILEAIEKLRARLKDEGIPALGLKSLDPIEIEDDRFQIDNKLVKADLNLTNTRAEGLLGFSVTKLKIGIVGLKVEYTVTWPLLAARGSYGVDASTEHLPNRIYGNGNVDVEAKGLTVSGAGKVGTKLVNGKLKIYIKELSAKVALGDFNLKITGLYNDEERSAEISDYLTKNLSKLLKEQEDKINKILNEIIKIINDAILGKNYFEFDYIHCGDY